MSSLKIGSQGQAVKNLQGNLNALGSKLTVDGNFGEVTQVRVIVFQKSRGLTADGIVGPITQSEIAKALIEVAQKSKGQPVKTVPVSSGSTPWRQWFLDRLGWTEFDHDKELSQGWQYTNVPNYKTVVGSVYAWCAESLGLALIVNGYTSSHDASALSYVTYGTEVLYLKSGIPMGAIVVIEHASGGHHVTTANRDHKVGELVVEGLGGNQDNEICVEKFVIDPKVQEHHKVLAVRWPVAA